jgi:hypothetical protein
MNLNEDQIKELCEILDREFPLMSSRRFRFFRASDLVQLLASEGKSSEVRETALEKYRKWKAADFHPKADPWNENYDTLYGE